VGRTPHAGISQGALVHRLTRPAGLVAVDTAVEGVTGIALMLAPGVVSWLLIAARLDAAGAFVARVAGIALVALCVACWTGARGPGIRGAVAGLLLYNLLCAAYLGGVGLARAPVGPLLWPAVVVHTALAVLLAAAWRRTAEAR
jgi:hypothetical protein